MRPVMVDSCVLLDILTEDPKWFSWSAGQLAKAASNGILVVNPIIFSEVSITFDSIEAMDELFSPDCFDYRPISKEAAFLAGKYFLNYRKRRGTKTLPLPDFFIGAQAAIEKLPLLTRDAKRFKTYFPTVELITPQ